MSLAALLLSGCMQSTMSPAYDTETQGEVVKTSEQLLAANGNWTLAEDEASSDPLEWHRRARERVNPNDTSGQQFISQDKIDMIAQEHLERDENFRLVRLERNMKGLRNDVELSSVSQAAKDQAEVLADIRPAAGLVEVPLQSHFVADGNDVELLNSKVQAVRFGEHPDKVRVVLDLSAPTSGFRAVTEEGGRFVRVELPSSAWSADMSKQLNSRLVKGYSVEQLAGGGTVLRIEMNGAGRVLGSSALPPNTQFNHHRIYFDLSA
ncbi:MAG: hypothetical protein ACK4VI_05835 [Alphaproteobacteria bacterium]